MSGPGPASRSALAALVPSILALSVVVAGCGTFGGDAAVVAPLSTPGAAPADGAGSGTPDLSGPPATAAVGDPGSTVSVATLPPATGAPAVPVPAVPSPDPATTGTTSVPFDGAVLRPVGDPVQVVALSIESEVADVTTGELRDLVLATLNDPRGWPRAGFSFEASSSSPFRVVLAEGSEVDRLCLPLETYGTVSCQNGPVVALNADRWRNAVDHWDGDLATYRGYLINHEVGHLLGQRHPKPRCPTPGRPAAVMEQQTAGLEGCTGNAWPRDWEIELAAGRPVVYAPLPDWAPEPGPVNAER